MTWSRRMVALAALALALAPLRSRAVAQEMADARQVTLFAILATPGSSVLDPKLAEIESQLRKLLPGHGFKLLGVQSKRLQAGQSVRCNLGSGWVASTALLRPLDENGKVELRCGLWQNGVVQFDTRVATPTNQLFFCDRMIDGGARILVGVGAR